MGSGSLGRLAGGAAGVHGQEVLPGPARPAVEPRMLMEAVEPPNWPHTRLVRDLGRLSWLMKGVRFDLFSGSSLCLWCIPFKGKHKK